MKLWHLSLNNYSRWTNNYSRWTNNCWGNNYGRMKPTTTVEENNDYCLRRRLTTGATTEAVTEAQSAPTTTKLNQAKVHQQLIQRQQLPDYANIAATKSENAGLQPNAALKKK